MRGKFRAPGRSPFLLVGVTRRVLPSPSPQASPAVVRRGRESLPACFLKLGLDRSRKGHTLGGRDVGVWPCVGVGVGPVRGR